ncbi:hypothetical protein D3C71_1399270 [compost metagenome]
MRHGFGHGVDPLRLQLLDDVTVVLLGEEAADGCRHHRAHVRHGRQRVFIGVHDGVDAAEMPRNIACGGFSDVTDAQREQQAVQARLARLVDGSHQVVGGLLAHAVQAYELQRAQAVQVGQGFDPAAVHQLVHQFLAQAFDVQRLAAGRVPQGLLALGAAEQAARAARNGFVFKPFDGRAADRAGREHDEFLRVVGALFKHGAQHFRNDVTSATHDDRVALAHVLAANFVFVMQRGVGDGHAAHEDGLQARHRGDGTGAAYLDFDIQQRRGGFLGGELMGQGEARCARHKTQHLLRRQ